MAEDRPRRMSLMERASKPEVPKFKFSAPPPPPRKRVSFAESEDVRIFEVDRDWLPGNDGTSSDRSDESDATTSEQTPAPDTKSTPIPAPERRRSSLLLTSLSLLDQQEAISPATDWRAEADEEWSRISMAAQKKVHEEAGRNNSLKKRLSLVGEGPMLPAVLPEPQSVEPERKKPKKKKKPVITGPVIKKLKKKPPVSEPVTGTAEERPKRKKKKKKKKKKEKKERKMSVMAFLRGSIKRGSKAKVEKALRKMMRRIAKRVKRKQDKLVQDKDLDMAEIKKRVRKPRRKKKLYTVKKIRGRNIGLKSLLKRWKWAFIFS